MNRRGQMLQEQAQNVKGSSISAKPGQLDFSQSESEKQIVRVGSKGIHLKKILKGLASRTKEFQVYSYNIKEMPQVIGL